MSVPGVDEVQSVSSDSTTQIQITYVDGTDRGHRRHQTAGAV